MFVANFEQLSQTPAGSIDTSRVPLLATPSAHGVLAPFVGKEIDQKTLASLHDAVQKYYARIDRPFVAVTIPPQEVTGGLVRIVVTESRLDRVLVKGNRWFDAAQYRDAVRLRSGQPIDMAKLNADLAWINQNQYRHATVEADQGRSVGTTDLIVHAQDRFPVSFNAGIDNTGNVATGLTRLSTGFDWGNAFFRGDDLNYTYLTTPDGSTVQQHEASYTTTLPSRSSINLSGTYALSQTAAASAVNSTGLTTTLGLRYIAPLQGTTNFTQQLTGGTDYKSTNNNVLFGGVSVFPTTTKIYDFMVNYTPGWSDHLGGTNGNVSVFLSPGGLGNANTTTAFSSQQPGAQARYTYANASILRWFNFHDGMTWQFRVQAQVSTANLLPSEQLNFGYPSIRGFAESFATRDEGVLISTQLMLRPFPLGFTNALRINARDLFQAFAFADYGTGWNHQDIAGVSSYVRMLTFGPGFTYQIGTHLYGRFDYGFVVQRFGVPMPGGQADLALQLRS